MTRKKNTNLKLVETQQDGEANRKPTEESWKLTRNEIAARVRRIRRELEEVKERFDGAVFDAMTVDGPPRSLYGEGIREPEQLVKYLNPTVEGMYRRACDNIDGKAEDDLMDAFCQGIETAYQIGMLAGAIFADAPASTLDRFERGLAHATTARHWEAKK